VKLLLTSGGITNASIHDTLVDLLGKPIAESSALCVPTAIYAFPGGAISAYKLITGSAASPLCGLGWKSLGVLELTALPSIEAGHWASVLQETDALLVGGGDPLYLSYWMQQSGLAALLPELRTVYVGVSAGSLVMGAMVGLGAVDFSMFPHLDHPDMPDHSMANAEKWADKLSVSGYAVDDQTAIRVVDDAVEVVSEGHWKLFTPHS
jgi:dipeptidase E